MTRSGHPSRVSVRLSSPEGTRSGLLSDSVIMTDNLVTLLESEIDRTIGHWANMGDIDAALRYTLGL